MQKNYPQLPTISLIIPTYNAGKDLSNCLKSIAMQDYPKKKLEVLIIDGGSNDKTLEIAKEFSAFKKQIFFNPYKDAESGKAIGIEHSKSDIIGLIDADNELVESNWLKTMVKPLQEDATIFGVESPWYLRKQDPLINQYATLLGIADPLARRFHPRTEIQDKGNYFIHKARFGDTPVIGANGFLWRKDIIDIVGGHEKKFEEVNFVARVIEGGYLSYAKVKSVGIYHYYCTSVVSYVRKRIKIGRKFLARKEKQQTTWVDHANNQFFFLAVLYNISIICPLYESIIEYRKTRNIAWFLHPFISFLTILVYAYVFLQVKIKHFFVHFMR